MAFKRIILTLAVVIAIGQLNFAAEEKSKPEEKKPEFPPINKVVEDAEKKFEGFFTLYKKDDSLFMEVPASMLNKPFLISDTFSKGYISCTRSQLTFH